MSRRVRVLVVDDSALARQAICRGLALDPDIEVVGEAADAYMARDQILKSRPDVMTLDVEMPRMNGVEFLRRLMPQYPLPVVMVSSLTQAGCQITIDALQAGAVDFVAKPSGLGADLASVLEELRVKVKLAATIDVSHWAQKSQHPGQAPVGASKATFRSDLLVAIGASTGGTEATRKILSQLPAAFPGIVITQHMPPGFTSMYAESLDRCCQMRVREARDGDAVRAGEVLIAPGGRHMRLRRGRAGLSVSCEPGEPVNGHCPSVDVLFDSVAQVAGPRAVGVILTGMGGDGARGLLAMARAGARTIGQDEATSVVYGMPKEAHKLGAVQKQLALPRIPSALVELVSGGGHV
ncbi:MAG: chemotaxis response regulator protein-glutamate methylesterase [Deltaproteobacteria bacterium]|nr:MAG: chemotaxis response regulator protein-glutamate methylesterase [Deltaproteobacteria bacterium]